MTCSARALIMRPVIHVMRMRYARTRSLLAHVRAHLYKNAFHPATITSYYQSKATGRATFFFVSGKTVTQNGGETEGLRHDR